MSLIRKILTTQLIFLLFCSPAFPQTIPDPNLHEIFLKWLDRNNDDLIEAHEGAEAFLFLVDEADQDDDGCLTSDELAHFFAKQKSDVYNEQLEVFKELDADDNEAISFTELPEEFRPMLFGLDLDGDKALAFSEFLNAPFDDPLFFLEQDALAFMIELDHDGDGIVYLSDFSGHEQKELARIDRNGDGKLIQEEFFILVEEELRGAVFEVEGRSAVMTGAIGPSTPGRVLELILEHPDVDTIVMKEVPGSMDDESNIRAARLVRQHGFTTNVPRGGMIASGGTDFFLAGVQRFLDPMARVGVHSWGGFNEEGVNLPQDHQEHKMYLDYYDEMGTPAEFYWFTLKAAPADDIHWMTVQEINRFAMVTGEYESESRGGSYGLDTIDISVDERRGIVPIPEHVAQEIRTVFDRYTRITAPNGKPIHLLAQSAWSEDQIVHARKVLEHLLTDAPGTLYGSDKGVVANAMSDRCATLVLFETQEAMEAALDGDLGELNLSMQDLRANECPVEGSEDYMDHGTRDAAFEEILHLVHDYGIRPALPQFDREIQRCSDQAEKAGLWDPWPKDEPDSFRNEYIAAIYDNYLDLWTLPPTFYEGQPLEKEDIPEGTSHFGAYTAGSRKMLAELDPEGFALIEKFFPPALTYVAELPVEFSGVFKLALDPDLRYTMKSQHLRHVMLRGDGPAELVGNDHPNKLFGNRGNNLLEGRGGDDLLIGGPGEDTAVFQGAYSEYGFKSEGDFIRVTDSDLKRDGSDLLKELEQLRFTDCEVNASSAVIR